MYQPDKWLVAYIDSEHPHYKVFATWSGSYLFGSSWRLNSGIVSCSLVDGAYEFVGTSGTVYRCNQSSYGMTAAGSVLDHYIQAAKLQDVDIIIMPEDTDWLSLDWKLSV